MVTVPVGVNGRINLYNKGGAAHAVIDVQGWYAEDDTVRAAKGMGAQFLVDAQRRRGPHLRQP